MAKCKGCGAEILWAVNENDKMIPLDAKAPVYVLTIREDMGAKTRCQRAEKGRAFVSHFSTCPKANEFSRAFHGLRDADLVRDSGSKKKLEGLVE